MPSAAVGSSSSTTFGSPSSERAIATAWRWPPDSDATSVRTLRSVVTPSESSSSTAFCSIAVSSRTGTPGTVFATLLARETGWRPRRGSRTGPGPGRRSRSRARSRPAGSVEPDGRPSNRASPASGGCAPGDRLDQGRLAGAVVADEADDLARVQLEVDVLERLDRRRSSCVKPFSARRGSERGSLPATGRGRFRGYPLTSPRASGLSLIRYWMPASLHACAYSCVQISSTLQ